MSIDDEYHGYGTWHFVSIFLIVSVIAVVGYFFVHNRKKVILSCIKMIPFTYFLVAQRKSNRSDSWKRTPKE